MNKLIPISSGNDTFIPKRKITKQVTHNTIGNLKITLCMLGCWGVEFPPYNLARLSSLLRSAGYKTTVFDFNVDSYVRLEKTLLKNAWSGANYFWWSNQNEYDVRIRPHLEPILHKYVQKILSTNPDVVGLSILDTNMIPSEWIAAEIKRIAPHIKIVIGGPKCQNSFYCDEYKPYIDYIVRGEGEQTLIDLLASIENNEPNIERIVGSLYEGKRVDLDSLPFPDYSDYDLKLYRNQYGVSAEFSRGCIAKCTFCTETWFWKFRDRYANRVVDEIEYQVKNYGINFVWFIDSLLNGNLKELRKFAIELVKRNLNITWTGYARCDGRMDIDYLQDLKNSGCSMISYGVESGSQCVLDEMKKQITVAEAKQNLRDTHAVGIKVHVNWIVGAPAEDVQAVNHSLNFIWDHAEEIHNISLGETMGDAHGSEYDRNRDKYLISENKQMFGRWFKTDLTNTILNRFIRLKMTFFWADMCRKFKEVEMTTGIKGDSISDYSFTRTNNAVLPNSIPYENINYNLLKGIDFDNFENSVINEVWSFLRIAWRALGSYTCNLSFDHDRDLKNFGEGLAQAKYYATIEFTIQQDGTFDANFVHALTHDGEYWINGNRSFKFAWSGSGVFTDQGIVLNEPRSISSETAPWSEK